MTLLALLLALHGGHPPVGAAHHARAHIPAGFVHHGYIVKPDPPPRLAGV